MEKGVVLMVIIEIQLREEIVKSIFTMAEGHWQKEDFEKDVKQIVRRYYECEPVRVVWDGDVMWDEEDSLWLAAFVVDEDNQEGIATESRMLQDILLLRFANRIRRGL